MIVKVVENEAQLQDAMAVRMDVFVKEQQISEAIEMDEFDKIAIHVVLYDDEFPIGAGRFREVDGYGKVERICVRADYRKHGSGKIIMNKIEQLAKEHNLFHLKLNAQTTAIPFYKRLGYTVTSDEFMDADIPHVEMKKILKK